MLRELIYGREALPKGIFDDRAELQRRMAQLDHSITHALRHCVEKALREFGAVGQEGAVGWETVSQRARQLAQTGLDPFPGTGADVQAAFELMRAEGWADGDLKLGRHSSHANIVWWLEEEHRCDAVLTPPRGRPGQKVHEACCGCGRDFLAVWDESQPTNYKWVPVEEQMARA